MIQNILELTPNEVTNDITSYNFLLYSKPGIGKTTWATKMFPNRAVILGAEFGYKGIKGALGVPIPDYYTLIQYVEQFDTDAAREKYDTLIIDTTTKVGEIIEEYILSTYGKDSLGEAKAHGGAYPLINRYYNLAFNRLKARGYNFVYICHATEIEIKNEKNEVVGYKSKPKMSDRINSLIEPEVDYTFFLTLDKNTGERILVTDNTLKNVGKQRTYLPKVMKMDIDTFMDEFKKGADITAGGQATDKKVSNNVIGFKESERNYKEVVAEIKSLGQSLAQQGKLNDATVIVNNKLGKDDNGMQRTLDIMTQENIQMLETIVLELKKL